VFADCRKEPLLTAISSSIFPSIESRVFNLRTKSCGIPKPTSRRISPIASFVLPSPYTRSLISTVRVLVRVPLYCFEFCCACVVCCHLWGATPMATMDFPRTIRWVAEIIIGWVYGSIEYGCPAEANTRVRISELPRTSSVAMCFSILPRGGLSNIGII
jgi:hypothetical protein